MNTLAVKNFVEGVKTEAKKVSWPTRKEVVASSGIVLVLVLAYLGFILDISNFKDSTSICFCAINLSFNEAKKDITNKNINEASKNPN
jgi:preprotein translocase subunit SecE